MNRFKVFISKGIITALLLLWAYSFLSIFAQEEYYDEDKDVPPGMEVRKIGSVELLVPKGTKIYKKGGLITIETTSRYVVRRFLDIENRLAEIVLKEEKLKKEIEQLKKALAENKQKEESLKEELKKLKEALAEVQKTD